MVLAIVLLYCFVSLLLLMYTMFLFAVFNVVYTSIDVLVFVL